jgi:hypothetical protein
MMPFMPFGNPGEMMMAQGMPGFDPSMMTG